jgi:MinD superfamily P-loop ATPase
MYLYYKGKQTEEESFYSGKTARINSDKCIRCGKCFRNCKFDAIKDYKVDSLKCEGCGVCKLVCPVGAIEMFDNHVADIIEEKIKNGNLIRADMEIGADGSGRLIAKLRSKVKNNNEIIIIDGSPGIGCPVIASITDTDLCLVVTEPTLSGLNDLERILELVNSFKIKVLVCINKYDINLNMTEKIKIHCKENNIEIIGLIPYDDIVIKSINDLKPIISYQTSRAGVEIKKIAEKILKIYKEEYL